VSERVPERGEVERAGALAIVLHSHMPYVEGFGTWPFGEEWLFDAFLRSYAPVLEVAERLTLTVTPVLADQLEAPGVGERLAAFGRRYRLAASEEEAAEAAGSDPGLAAAFADEAERYSSSLARLEECGGEPLELFRRARERGVELAASAATHAVLPLVATDAVRRLQIDAGLRSHRRRFGQPTGFWLPECGYEPGLERLLAEHGLGWFCVDQSAYEEDLDALAPVRTEAGPVAFTIDWTAIEWLWSWQGYPSDPLHSDFHRRSPRGGRPWSIAGAPRDPAASRARAREQAREFLASAAQRLRKFHARRGREGLLVFAVDTELLGHWWWEGPHWLAEVLAGAQAEGLELLTLGEALERFEPDERPLRRGTWGEGKDFSTWDAPEVADLAWGARRLELHLLARLGGRGVESARALRAARELLAAQASDWTFLDKRKQAGDYPYQRATTHARNLFEALDSRRPPAPELRNLAPDLHLAPLFRS
jgi:1,4-alpha-glucan branching enzyme